MNEIQILFLLWLIVYCGASKKWHPIHIFQKETVKFDKHSPEV